MTPSDIIRSTVARQKVLANSAVNYDRERSWLGERRDANYFSQRGLSKIDAGIQLGSSSRVNP